MAAVVKSNDGASREKWTLLREPNGSSARRDPRSAGQTRADRPSLLRALVERDHRRRQGRAAVHQDGRQRALSSGGPSWARRSPTWPSTGWSKMADELLQAGAIVAALATGTTVKWLDVPDGPFARGEGEFAAGASTAKAGGRAFGDAR